MAKLRDAGMQVLAERGYQAARVDDIVRLADTSHGTFYLYFANKEDLFRSLAADCAGEIETLLAGLGPVDRGLAGRQELHRWLAEFVDAYRRYGSVIRAWMENQVADRKLVRLGRQTFDEINQSLLARLEEASPSHLPDRAAAAAALLAMLERFTYFLTSRDLGIDEDAAIDTLATIVHRGFFGAPA